MSTKRTPGRSRTSSHPAPRCSGRRRRECAAGAGHPRRRSRRQAPPFPHPEETPSARSGAPWNRSRPRSGRKATCCRAVGGCEEVTDAQECVARGKSRTGQAGLTRTAASPPAPETDRRGRRCRARCPHPRNPCRPSRSESSRPARRFGRSRARPWLTVRSPPLSIAACSSCWRTVSAGGPGSGSPFPIRAWAPANCGCAMRPSRMLASRTSVFIFRRSTNWPMPNSPKVSSQTTPVPILPR